FCTGVALATVEAAETLRTLEWTPPAMPPEATLAGPDRAGGEAHIWVENRSGSRLTIALASLDGSGISTPFWAVRGTVKSEQVQGEAFLELWSIFPDGSRYF
ncbi:MAG: hypothetical protein V1750_04610, partial [Acidobacteriota bacterium]